MLADLVDTLRRMLDEVLERLVESGDEPERAKRIEILLAS